ncbi:hypothetical protein A2Z22_00815 [Candidatus Woesebacteria bacterium RBG_16_34_12]|uniref:Uncharacterized protein n=1 Tax=Candidatus Woesebacteria bacterium RBG_16_34_12 TaxID=1802480 RepID=A0A1F7X8V0_9BACT|nr:MAG: hypothetical protein A2Z22_00815 [Candidatus Woesebacteria bacterium RBG_16_34_12]
MFIRLSNATQVKQPNIFQFKGAFRELFLRNSRGKYKSTKRLERSGALRMISERHKAGIIIFIIILTLINLSSVYGILFNFVKPENSVPFEIPLCKVINEVTIDVAKQEIEKYLSVPDYDAKVFINTSKQNYIVDDNAGINIEIQDKGIIKLNKPYFYLLIYAPSDKLKEMFPCFINEKEKSFISEKNSNYYPHKWDKWDSPKNVFIGNQVRSCTDQESFYFSPNTCVHRQDLMNGIIGNNPIRYTFRITEPGTWKIYVFLFDDEYKFRPNVGLLKHDNMPESFQNAVAYGYYELIVNSEAGFVKSSNFDLLKFLSEYFNIILAFISSYVLSTDVIYPKLKDVYHKYIEKLKSEILRISVILVIITIYLWIIFKF